MKNLSSLLFVVICLFANNLLNAQELAGQYSPTDAAPKVVKIPANDVEILTNFKATKEQKKVINKIKKYVSPRVLGRSVQTAALEGKTVKLQMSLDAQGQIGYIVVVDGIEPKLNERVISLVEEYNENNPLVGSGLENPTVIQMEIPIVSNKYYGG